jgi:hypothetical protein
LDKETLQHLARLRAALFNTYQITDATRWITDHTYLNGDRFSFKNHEYQEQIISDPTRVVSVQKPAQIGMSELMSRYILALCKIIPNFSAILTFPYSGDAEDFMKTRIAGVIRESRTLRESLDPALDNVAIKGIGTSLLYARGTSGNTQALSIPADILVHDEIDKSDPAIIGQYQSRIRHSKWGLVRKFSTPTLSKRGISAEMDVSRRYRNICKCHHCNYDFVPDYFEHVKVPGYSGDLKEIDKENIRKLNWQGAQLLCPSCGKVPDLGPAHREWVIENPDDNFDAIGYFCSPFDVPHMTSTANLVAESTRYGRYSEFMNQGLGLVANNTNEQITEVDLLESRINADLKSTNVHCMGADMGLTCHIVIGRLQDGMLLVVHRERVLLGNFEQRKIALQREYRVIITVCDSQPYTDLILRMQTYDKNLYGAVYHTSKTLAVYEIKKVDPNEEDGKLPINQARIKRDLAFDEIMHLFKAEPRRIAWSSTNEEDDEQFMSNLLDMKREQKVDKNQEIIYTWTKSEEGRDHFHHGLLYLYTACRLMPTVDRGTPVVGVPIIGKFAVKAYSRDTDRWARR